MTPNAANEHDRFLAGLKNKNGKFFPHFFPALFLIEVPAKSNHIINLSTKKQAAAFLLPGLSALDTLSAMSLEIATASVMNLQPTPTITSN